MFIRSLTRLAVVVAAVAIVGFACDVSFAANTSKSPIPAVQSCLRGGPDQSSKMSEIPWSPDGPLAITTWVAVNEKTGTVNLAQGDVAHIEVFHEGWAKEGEFNTAPILWCLDVRVGLLRYYFPVYGTTSVDVVLPTLPNSSGIQYDISAMVPGYESQNTVSLRVWERRDLGTIDDM